MIKETLSSAVIGVALLGGLLWGIPQYKVYSYEMRGTAILAQADQERQVLISKAKAEKEAATLQAEAIAIVGKAYAEFPEYRKAMYMEAMAEAVQNGNIRQMMYIPTEAGIPITEAGRFANE